MKMKPKYVYAAISVSQDNKMQIVGCFYDKEAAERYAGNSSSIIIQKLSVI